jgi:hypothetical protein
MIALSWLLWLVVIVIQAIVHFCFIGRRNTRNRFQHSSKAQQEQQPEEEREETKEKHSSSRVEFQDRCVVNHETRKMMITEKKESISSILKNDHHGLRRRRIRSDVSLVSDQNLMKPLIHSISTSTDEFEYGNDNDDQYLDNVSQDFESDLDEEEDWRLALIQRYIENNPPQESFVSINMLNRSLDSIEDEEKNDGSASRNRMASAVTATSTSNSSVPLVCT